MPDSRRNSAGKAPRGRGSDLESSGRILKVAVTVSYVQTWQAPSEDSGVGSVAGERVREGERKRLEWSRAWSTARRSVAVESELELESKLKPKPKPTGASLKLPIGRGPAGPTGRHNVGLWELVAGMRPARSGYYQRQYHSVAAAWACLCPACSPLMRPQPSRPASHRTSFIDFVK